MIDIAHVHPMFVHFPLALVPVAVGAQTLALMRGHGLFGRSCLSATGVALILIAAAGAIVAAVFGDIALDRAVASGVPLARLETHEELGKATAALLALLAAAELWLYRKAAAGTAVNRGLWMAGLALLILLLTTAWFGGQLVYEQGVNVATSTPLQGASGSSPGSAPDPLP